MNIQPPSHIGRPMLPQGHRRCGAAIGRLHPPLALSHGVALNEPNHYQNASQGQKVP